MSKIRVEATCPSCVRLYRLTVDSADLEGTTRKTAVCGRCRARFDILEAARASLGAAPGSAAGPAEAAPAESREERFRRKMKKRYTLPMTAAVTPRIFDDLRAARASDPRRRFTPAGAWAVHPDTAPPAASSSAATAAGDPPSPLVAPDPRPASTPLETSDDSGRSAAPEAPTPMPLARIALVSPAGARPTIRPARRPSIVPSEEPRFEPRTRAPSSHVSWAAHAASSLDALCEDEPLVHHAVVRVLSGR